MANFIKKGPTRLQSSNRRIGGFMSYANRSMELKREKIKKIEEAQIDLPEEYVIKEALKKEVSNNVSKF